MVLSLDRFIGKVAIVTGASSGIGAALVEQLTIKGLIVVGIARRSERVQELSDKLKGHKGKLYALKADISKENELLDAFKWVSENLGPVHVLVNNAGVNIRGDTLTNAKTETWRRQFDLNVIALSVATREAVKIMRANEIQGHIVHINSIAGHRVRLSPGNNVYPATKHAVTALTETLRQEFNHLGLKIKITSVSPGLVDTEFGMRNPNYTEEEKKKYYGALAATPLQAEDVADGVVYALSTPAHVQVHELMILPL